MRVLFLFLIMLLPLAGIAQQVYVKQFRLERYNIQHHALIEKQGKDIGISRYELDIFNRWGQQVFHGENKPCNGTAGDKSLPEGVYIYKVKVWDIFDQYKTAAGNVTLMR